MLKGFVSGEEKDIVRIPMKGKNLYEYPYTLKLAVNGTGHNRTVYAASYIEANIIKLKPNTTYRITGKMEDATDKYCRIALFDEYPVVGSVSTHYYFSVNNSFTVFTTGADEVWAILLCASVSDIPIDYNRQLTEGSTPLPYEPYGYQEGWEVRDNGDRLIWGREDELQTATGTLPFKGYSLPLKVKSLLGNAVQNGTPAPDNITIPEMCGVLNESLAIIESDSYSLNDWYYEDTRLTDLLAPGTYTISFVTDSITAGTTTDGTIGIGTTSDYTEDLEWFTRAAAGSMTTITVTLSESKCLWAQFVRDHNIVKITCSISVSKIRVEEGSTAYGWKISFENHGENLFDCERTEGVTTGKYINAAGTVSDNPYYNISYPIYVEAGVEYTWRFDNVQAHTAPTVAFYNAGGTQIGVASHASNVTHFTFTTPSNCAFIRASVYIRNNSQKEAMLNLGSTPKPYSPYLNETLPVYLGEVPTVRRIKKVVFTGQETWTEVYPGEPEAQAQGIIMYATSLSEIGTDRNDFRCSHFFVGNYRGYLIPGQGRINGTSTSAVPEAFNVNYNNGSGGLQNFKAWLASEYAAGHPVTLWYALAAEQTSVANEPLCKISTYADELTTIQVHGLSAPLYGIRDYKDILNLSTGVVTRKVKKLVLTGTETSWEAGTGSLFILSLPDVLNGSGITSCLCSNYTAVPNFEGNYSALPDGCCSVRYNHLKIWFRDISVGGIDNFKSYLAAQYQNGTPVTIWYVLNTPTTETVTVPTGMTGEIEGYLTQVSTPTPTNRSVPKWNGVEETGGTYAVTVYTPPEIPTTTGQNTLTVDSNLAPSKLEVSVHAKKIHYGFKIDKSNDNSESAVIYTHDAVTMTPAHMDFTNDRFDYGSWGNAFFVRDCYPVALNLDGTIAYRLDPDDYTKKTDGTPSDIFYELLTAAPSDWSTQWKQYYTKSGDEYVLNDQSSAPTFATDTYYNLTYNPSFTGNFMMAFPKVWFYRHEDSQYNYIEVSNHRLSDDWKCYAHINTNGQEVDFIYLPLFKGVIKDSKLRSLPGQIPQGNTTATNEVNAATALGSRWQIWDHSSVELINDLLTLMSKSIDSQGRFGKGRESGYDSTDTVTYGKLQTGTLIKVGKFHGFSSSYKEVKVFGIESFWANRWDRLQGMLLVNNVWKIKMTPPYNFIGTDFVTLSNAEVPSGNGYLSKVQTSEYGSIPASIANGSSTKYFKDYFYKTATDTRVAIRGGSCNNGGYAGFRFVSVRHAASASPWDIGASPVYK